MKPSKLLFAAACLGAFAPNFQSAQAIKFAPPQQIQTNMTNSSSGLPYFGDFNGDGNTDILVPTGNGVNVLFGDGNGNFSIVQSNSLSNIQAPLFVGDLNGDGKSDVVIYTLGDYQGSPGSLTVWIGDGNGKFTPGAQYTVPNGVYTAVTGDFNGDGKLDFVLNIDNENPYAPPAFEDQILFKGKGDGTFMTSNLNLTSEANLGTEVTPFSGDFNGDGHLDLAFETAYYGVDSTSIYVAYGHGDGTFSVPALLYVANAEEESLPPTVAELNGDKKDDLVLSLAAKEEAGAQPRIATLLARQTDGFYWQSNLSLPYVADIAVADLNGDGKPDLVAYGNTSTPSFKWFIWTYQGKGTGSFADQSSVDVSSISDNQYPWLFLEKLRRGGMASIITYDVERKGRLELLKNISK